MARPYKMLTRKDVDVGDLVVASFSRSINDPYYMDVYEVFGVSKVDGYDPELAFDIEIKLSDGSEKENGGPNLVFSSNVILLKKNGEVYLGKDIHKKVGKSLEPRRKPNPLINSQL